MENKTMIVHEGTNLYGLVEVSLINNLKDPISIEKFDIHDTADAKFKEIFQLNREKQKIGKRGTFKFIMKYELNKQKAVFKDFGKVQFNWNSERPEVAGGVLAYFIMNNQEKRPEDITMERKDSKILKKFQLTDVSLILTNP